MTEMKNTEKKQITNPCKPYRHQKNYEEILKTTLRGKFSALAEVYLILGKWEL